MHLNRFDLDSFEYGVGYDLNNNIFMFDKDDFDKIKKYYWYLNANKYMQTNDDTESGLLLMHHLIMNSHWIDHKNRNRTDNRKCNLRHTNSQNNNRNRSITLRNKTGFIGVKYRKNRKKPWYAVIKPTLESNAIAKAFNTKEEAIVQRLKWENEFFGEFAPQKHLFKEFGIDVDKLNKII